ITVRSELKTIADKNEISLSSKQQTLTNQIKTNNQLVTQRQKLLNQIKALKLDNSNLQNRIANQSEEVERQWFIKGAAVIIMGIFIGLVVPHLPRRKKKNDNWA
ncbi:MAG: TIGR04211 family SH3 domain-containing protein, partial [Oceanospirillaceae bacterium]